MGLSPALYLPKSFLGLPLYIGVELVLGIAIFNKMAGFYGVLSLLTGHPIEFTQWIFYLSSLLIVPFYVNGLQNVKNPNLARFSLISLIYFIDTVSGIVFILHFAYQWFSTNDTSVAKIPNTPTETSTSVLTEPTTKSKVASSSSASHDSSYSSTSVSRTKIPTSSPTASSSFEESNYEIESPDESGSDKDVAVFELEEPKKNFDRLLRRSIELVGTNIILALVSRDTESKLSSQSASETYELMTTILTCIFVVVARVYFTLVILSFTRLLLKSTKYGVNSDDFNNRKMEGQDENSSKFKKFLQKIENKSVDIIVWLFNE
ncbi:Kei1 protein [Saccharomycopsis crataegensis]|uniref:Kei1 protein n=1 Tax=Saccharomycopsis crataegensis TaxID=43959 RepID=A0AAV5QFD8_9ASCO|nr:Kei1 protein [Saccharomycopsis crataegensis]